MDIITFNQYKLGSEGYDFVNEFDLLINEYLSKNQPVALFKEPIIAEDSYYAKHPNFPILSYEDIKYTQYCFYASGFKAILLIKFDSQEDCDKFEKKHFKDCTVIEYTYMQSFN